MSKVAAAIAKREAARKPKPVKKAKKAQAVEVVETVERDAPDTSNEVPE
jgi:hypothetical protein